MDQHYGPQNVTGEYIHFLDDHFEQESMRKIVKRLRMSCDAVGRRQSTQRHFREQGRSGNEEKEDVVRNQYVDTMDGLHFLLCHLEGMGLRAPAEVLQTVTTAVDDQQNEESLVDAVIKRMASQVAARRRALSVDRLDGAKNTKFNLSTMDNAVQSADGL